MADCLLTRTMNALRPVVMEFSYKPALAHLGLIPEHAYPVSNMVVYRCHEGDQRVIAKMARRLNDFTFSGQKNEADLLKRLDGSPLVPGYRGFYEGIPAAWPSAVTNFLRYGRPELDVLSVLVKRYLPGRELHSSEKITDTRQQEDLQETLRMAHKEGFAGFDVKPYNIIVSPDARMRLIDLETLSREEEDADFFQHNRRRDFERMEALFD